MRRTNFVVLMVALALVFVIGPSLAIGQSTGRRKVKRAAPPTFTEKDSKGIFFDDVFSEALVGDRPANLGRPSRGGSKPVDGGAGGGTDGGSGGGSDAGGLYEWKNIIAADVLSNEIKTIKLMVDKDVTTPSKFSGGGYKRCRKHFSMLATLFAIIGEYNGEVRFKKQAADLRELFAKAADGSKVGSQQAYNQAKLRKEDLDIVVNGDTITVVKPAEPKIEDWSKVVHRAPLMQRLEVSQQANIQPWLASADEFKKNKAKLVHEANLVAAISEVLTREGMEGGDEDDYAAHAHKMRDAAREIVSAVELENFDAARKAAGTIGQACSQCHQDWR